MSVVRGTVYAKGQAWSSSLLRYVDLVVDASGNLAVAAGTGSSDATAANQVLGNASLTTIANDFAVLNSALTIDADVPPLKRFAVAGETASLTQYPIPLGVIGRSVITEMLTGAAPISVTPSGLVLHLASGTASSSGNNLIVTPTSTFTLRVHYASYNPSAATTCAFRFGTSGTMFIKNALTTGGAVIAKDFGDFRYVEGAADESLYLNLSGAVDTIWNVLYSLGTT